MATVEMPGLYKVVARGKVYWYAWRNGPRIEAKPGTREFFEEYLRHKNPFAKLDGRKIGTWIAKFKASPEWADMSKSTKANWGPKLDAAKERFGDIAVSSFDKPEIRSHIKAWRDQWRANPRTADIAKQALSRFCSYMVEEGALTTNPCTGIASVYSSNRSEIIWLPDDMAVAEKWFPLEIYRATKFAALTGLRQEACLQATWNRIDDNCLDMTGTKFGGKGRGIIPLYKELRDFLDGLPRKALTILTTQDGEPWKTGFGSSLGKAMNLPGCSSLREKGLHFHDTRGTAATNFYRVGLTVQEIAITMGWSVQQVEAILDRYVRKADLMRDRAAKMDQIATLKENKKA